MNKTFKELAEEIGELVTIKNVSYGDSFGKTAAFLTLLFPNGIKPDQYEDLGCIFRMYDKLVRLATSKNAFDESPYKDIMGYALLGLKKDLDRLSKLEEVPKPVPPKPELPPTRIIKENGDGTGPEGPLTQEELAKALEELQKTPKPVLPFYRPAQCWTCAKAPCICDNFFK